MKVSTLQRLAACVGLCAATASITLLAVRARAAGIPDADVLTYTGYLEDADGQPLTNELSGISLEVWDAAEAGERLCGTSVEGVTPQAGRFQLVLPAECAEAVKATRDLWVDVKVEGASLGRTKLGAVPYAIEAAHATSADQASGALDERIGALESQVTPWASMTPSPTLADGAGSAITPLSLSGQFRRVGDSAEIMLKTVFNTPTTAASGYFTWSLPALLSVDAAKLGVGYATVGWALVNQNGVRETCAVNSSGGRSVAIDCLSGSLKSAVASAVVTMHITAPIEGWETP